MDHAGTWNTSHMERYDWSSQKYPNSKHKEVLETYRDAEKPWHRINMANQIESVRIYVTWCSEYPLWTEQVFSLAINHPTLDGQNIATKLINPRWQLYDTHIH